MSCHFLLQGIFPTQGLKPGLPHCKQILFHLSHQGIKTSMKHHLMLVRMAIIENLQTINGRVGVEKRGSLLHCWWECKLIQPLWRTVWRFLKKLVINLPYDPAAPLLGIYPEKIIIEKGTCTLVFIAALFTIARTWKQLRCLLTDE